MIDSDPFVQWIFDPDDRPVLPPVDDIHGLKDFSSLEIPTDLQIDRGYGKPSGLLLGPDTCHNAYQDAVAFDPITLPYGTPCTGKNVLLPTSDPSLPHVSFYTSLFPPQLSPDSSPSSIASSTPWLRTPQTDPSLTDAVNVDTLWGPSEIEESRHCPTIHFLDQAGNSLEDIPSQVQDVMLEDIACTPPADDASLPPVVDATPRGIVGRVTPTPLTNTPIFVMSPPSASGFSTVAVHWTPLSSSISHTSQSLFAFSRVTCDPQETPLSGHSASLSLSPLSTFSFLSQSPNASPKLSPLISRSSLSPTTSLLPPSNDDERIEVTDSLSTTLTKVNSAKLRGKRSAETAGDDPPPWKIPRRSRGKNVDEEEWNPSFARVKRPRVVASSQSTTTQTPALILNCSADDSSNCETGKGLEGQHSDATHTSCEICGQGFTRTSDYIRHIENSANHPETRKVWPCPYCDSTLGRKDALGRHIRTMHAGRAVVILEGISGRQLPEGKKGPSVKPIGQRKMPSRTRLRKDTPRTSRHR